MSEEDTLLVELTKDEYEMIVRERAHYKIIKKGVTYSSTPRSIHLDIDTPDHRVTYDLPKTGKLTVTPKKPSPDKKSFGVFKDLYNRLEFCAYRKTFRNHFLVYLNGEHIQLSPDQWKKLFRTNNNIGNFYGFLGKRKPLSRVKF